LRLLLFETRTIAAHLRPTSLGLGQSRIAHGTIAQLTVTVRQESKVTAYAHWPKNVSPQLSEPFFFDAGRRVTEKESDHAFRSISLSRAALAHHPASGILCSALNGRHNRNELRVKRYRFEQDDPWREQPLDGMGGRQALPDRRAAFLRHELQVSDPPCASRSE
jgi:hypothetical protein